MREYLVQRRKELNLSQQDVADALGISRQYYSAIEQGIRQKKLEITLVVGLAKALKTTITDIILEEDVISKAIEGAKECQEQELSSSEATSLLPPA